MNIFSHHDAIMACPAAIFKKVPENLSPGEVHPPAWIIGSPDQAEASSGRDE